MRYNILLVVVDCLRYDSALDMRALVDLSIREKGHWFDNHWATSHCTDPCMMNILAGRHPDDLRLYSMMFNDAKYEVPDNVFTIFHLANDFGYDTAFITNLRRWYARDVKHFSDTRDADTGRDYAYAERLVKQLSSPWLTVLHTDDCHTRYTNGSYEKAVEYTNQRIQRLIDLVDLENTVVIITSDHGEGLGQAGQDGLPIEQHGYGLWDFLTHIPLVIYTPQSLWTQQVDDLTDHTAVYQSMSYIIRGHPLKTISRDYVYQAGATPKIFHRGVVDRGQRQFIRATTKSGVHHRYFVGCKEGDSFARSLEEALKRHCDRYGLEYGDIDEEAVIAERLEGLGYWSQK